MNSTDDVVHSDTSMKELKFFSTEHLHEDTILLSFHDESSRNSLSLNAAKELDELIINASIKNIKSILFTAKGRVFCSGGNLRDYSSMQEAREGTQVNQQIGLILDRFSKCPIQTLALVDGDCFGGGIELLSAFDFVISSPHVLFAFWQRRVGLTFGWGGGERLKKRMSQHELVRLAMSAEVFGSAKACQLGLVDRVAPKGALLDMAMEYVNRNRQLPQAPLTYLKKWQGGERTEQKLFESLWWAPEHREALKKVHASTHGRRKRNQSDDQ